MTNGRKIKHTKNLADVKMYISPENTGLLLEELLNNNFNVSRACEKLNIQRSAYYYSLKYDAEFRNTMNFARDIISNIVSNGLIEGLSSNDLVVKHKYLELLSKSNILPRLLSLEAEGVESDIDKSTSEIILT